MTPSQLQTAGIRLFGRKKWKAKLATALAVDVSTIHRIMHRPEVPGPYEVAVKGLLQNRLAQNAIERAARRLLPRKFRRRPETSKRVVRAKEKKLIPYAGSEEIENSS